MKTLLKTLILICITVLFTNCGKKFNIKDPNAWKAKLCEGYWEDDYMSNSGKICMILKFSPDGTFAIDYTGGVTLHWDGKWSLYELFNHDDQHYESATESILFQFNENFNGYSQLAESLNYNEHGGDDGKFNMDFYQSTRCKHYMSADKIIDKD